MIPGMIFTGFVKFQGIVSVNDFRLPIRLQELLQASLCFLRSCCFARIRLDPLGGQVLHHDCISMIVSRFTTFTENFVICCNQITNIFCTKYDSANTSSARGPCDFGPLTGLTLSVFREVLVGSKDNSWEELACDWLSVFRNSVIHKILSEFLQPFRYVIRVSPNLLVILIFIWFWEFWFVYSTTLLMFQKNTGLPVLAFPHFHLTRLRDGDPSLSCLKGDIGVEVGKLEEELADKPGTTIGTKFSVSHFIRIPFLMRCGFWPLIHSYEYPCSSQSFPSDEAAGVSSRTSILKNILLFFDISCGLFVRLHFTIGCYNRRRTSRCRHGFQFSGIQIFFADHVHRPSGVYNKFSFLWFKGWWRRWTPTFRRWEECCFLFFSNNFRHTFGQPPRCFTGTSLLPLLSLLKTDPQFLEHWVTLMRFTWANHSERRILVSNVSVTYDGFCELNSSDWFPCVWALPQNRWRLRRLHILQYANQLSCTSQHSHCTFVTILLKTFC